RVAPEHDVQAAGEPELPCVTRREHAPLETGAQRRHQAGKMRVAPGHVALAPGGPGGRRQHRLAAPGDTCAGGADQPPPPPPRDRPLPLNRPPDAVATTT